MCNATFKDMSLIGGQEDYLSSKQQIFDKKVLNFITKEFLFSESLNALIDHLKFEDDISFNIPCSRF